MNIEYICIFVYWLLTFRTNKEAHIHCFVKDKTSASPSTVITGCYTVMHFFSIPVTINLLCPVGNACMVFYCIAMNSSDYEVDRCLSFCCFSFGYCIVYLTTSEYPFDTINFFLLKWHQDMHEQSSVPCWKCYLLLYIMT